FCQSVHGVIPSRVDHARHRIALRMAPRSILCARLKYERTHIPGLRWRRRTGAAARTTTAAVAAGAAGKLLRHDAVTQSTQHRVRRRGETPRKTRNDAAISARKKSACGKPYAPDTNECDHNCLEYEVR